MGLDQFLYAKKHLYTEESEKTTLCLNLNNGFELKELTFEVCYWRKANAIHNWFVKNVQNGNDDCKEYWVSIEALKNLLDTINKILGVGVPVKEQLVNSLDGYEGIAKELLPTTSGFFFGGTDYDEDYFEELKSTKDILDKLMLMDEKGELKGYTFYYSSSW